MIYGPAFYKLLDIPESVAEPTAYDLLALDAASATPARVDEALRQRKLALRRNIPGPQLIPVVSVIERELDKAADILRDPARRRRYDERLAGRRDAAEQPAAHDRRALVAACGRAVREAVDADGCLPPDRRSALEARLRELGLPAEDAAYVLGNLPAPAGVEPQPALDDSEDDSPEAENAEEPIDTPIALEPLEPPQAQQEPEGARSAVAEFKLHVMALFPMGDADEAERKRLLSLAIAEGLSLDEGRAVLDDYLAPPSRAGGWSGRDRAARWRLVPWLLAVAAAVILIAGGYGVIELARRASREQTRAGASAGAGASLPPPASELLATALRLADVPGEVQRTFNDANDTAALPALPAAAKLLAKGAPQERLRAAGVFAGVLLRPGTRPAVQKAAVDALLAPLDAAADANEPAPSALYEAAHLLALALWLRESPSDRIARPRELALYVDRSRRAWTASLAAHPDDPLADPDRLTAAVIEGGDLAAYADRADPNALEAVTDGLVALAADPARAGAEPARAALLRCAAAPHAPPARRVARLALVRLIRKATHPAAAEQARSVLARELSLDPRDPLLDAALDTPEARRQVAAAFGRAVVVGRDFTAPPATGPATRAVAATGPATAPATRPTGPARLEPTPKAARVRAAWTPEGDRTALLTDVAVGVLAQAAEVAKFASRSGALDVELATMLAEEDPELRGAKLGRIVSFKGARAEPPTIEMLPEDVVERMRGDLRSPNAGKRNRTIEQLRVLGGSQAAGLLLERAGKLVRTAGASQFAEMNRILAALAGMNAPGVPLALAKMIEPARSNYAAHRVVMTLLTGTGYMGNTGQGRYHLPINHSPAARKAAAARWTTRAPTAPWGPEAIAVAGRTGSPDAWGPDERTERLLAVIGHYLSLSGGMLEAYRPAPDAAPPATPDVHPSRANVRGPVTAETLLAAGDLLVAQLTRLARRNAADEGKFAVRLDMIAVAADARDLACQTDLQRLAVRLATAGRLLDVLARQADRGRAKTPQFDAVAAARAEADAAAGNVLDQLRLHAWFNLILLEHLPTTGP